MTKNAKNIAALAVAFALVACSKSEPTPAAEAPTEPAAPEAPAIKVDKGVDLATKTIKVGALHDESGPAATIGKPYAIGKRVLAEYVNAGGSGLLPEGWKIELVTKDHSYNPQKSVQAYNQIKDDVLFIIESFGTPNTLPLRPMLERDQMIALPASLSSEMAKHRYTIPPAASYEVSARRAMDYIVDSVEDKSTIKAGIVYQQDDYGMDGLNGWKAAAAYHGVSIVSEQTVTPGQKDVAAVVTGLKKAGATHVLLTVLPSATGPILGTAAQLEYQPRWIGQLPTWIDAFFNKEVIPSAVFKNFEVISVVPYWGEKVPGMEKFIAAYEKYGKDQGPPDSYILLSYLGGLYGMEIAKRAIENGDITRAGLMKAVQSVENFDAGGLFQPVSTNTFPYMTSDKTRILAPDFENKTWKVVAPYASPQSSGKPATAAPTAQAEGEDEGEGEGEQEEEEAE